MIEVKDLCFDYPGKRAVNHVSLNISPNTITALVGPNGAGKTTLLRCLAALELPMNGTITIDGWQTDRFARKVHQVCSYLSDFYGLYDQLTVTQNLIFFAQSHRCEGNIDTKVQDTIKRLELTEHKDVAAGKLSRGLRQRLAIAQTIIHHPKVLLLDEPAAGLDPQARFHLSKLLLTLQKEGMTIVVSSHILSELEDYCSNMIVLDEGQLVEQSNLRDRAPNIVIIKVEFANDATQFTDILKSLPNINVQSVEGNVAILALKGDQNSQQALLKMLIEKDLPVLNVHEQKQRMQDVYLELSERHKTKEKNAKDKPTKE
ncbi:MAG: ABC transporter ATP-binding protein [Candidatus Berkiella sp.]